LAIVLQSSEVAHKAQPVFQKALSSAFVADVLHVNGDIFCLQILNSLNHSVVSLRLAVPFDGFFIGGWKKFFFQSGKNTRVSSAVGVLHCASIGQQH
tara:strand:- start:5045 stop:5335 length:291 start_codon:yes stop_codon:yes gene_type:complete